MENQNDKLMPEGFLKKPVASATYTANPKLPRNKMRFKAKIKLAVVILVVLTGIIFWGAYEVDQYFETHNLRFQTPIQTPVIIEKREAKAKTHLVAVAEAQEVDPYPMLNEIEKKICNAFGDDCLLALSVSHAENGTRECDRISKPNTDGTFDIGLFQLNSKYYLKQHGLKNLIDCDYNLHIAKTVAYANRGNTFEAFSTYNSGSYIKSWNHYVELMKK